MRRILPIINSFLVVLGLCTIGEGQTPVSNQAPVSWITSLSYEELKSPQSVVNLHIGLLQPGTVGYPCGPNLLTIDPISLQDRNFTGGGFNPNPGSVLVTAEKGGVVSPIRVGDNLHLPDGWTDFSVRVTVVCTESNQRQLSPLLKIRRVSSIDPLRISIKDSQIQWNRSGNGPTAKDSIAFAIITSRPVSIKNLQIKDANATYFRWSDSATGDRVLHDSIAGETLFPLIANSTYNFEVQLTEGGQLTTADSGLPDFHTPAQPTTEYTLTVLPKPEDLIIGDVNQPFTFIAQTSEAGDLSAIFDASASSHVATIVSKSSNGFVHTFDIPANSFTDDGTYGFVFSGRRSSPAGDLLNVHRSTLTVKSTPRIVDKSPIGISLSQDKSQILVTYCLSRQVATGLLLRSTSDLSSATTGKSEVVDGKGDCPSGTQYSGTVKMAEFINAAKTAPASSSSTTSASLTLASSSSAALTSGPTLKPFELHIVDKSGADRDIAILKLEAAMVSDQAKQVSDQLSGALSTLASNNADKTKVDNAKKTLTNLGLNNTLVDNLVQIARGRNRGIDVATTIGSVIGALGKGLVTTYLGIPANVQ